MSSRIVVTGIGIITSIGNNALETYDSLVNKKSGVQPLTILDTIHKNDFVAGEINFSHDELISLAGVDKSQPWTRTALLGLIAAREAYGNASLSANKNKIGLVSATTVGGMDRSERDVPAGDRRGAGSKEAEVPGQGKWADPRSRTSKLE